MLKARMPARRRAAEEKSWQMAVAVEACIHINHVV